MPSILTSSSSISLSIKFFFVPAYTTVASASVISLGYMVIIIYIKSFYYLTCLFTHCLIASLASVIAAIVVKGYFYIGFFQHTISG